MSEGARQSYVMLDLNKLKKIGTSYATSLEAFHFDKALPDQATDLVKQYDYVSYTKSYGLRLGLLKGGS